MIKMELHNNPGYPATNPEYLGFIQQWYKPAIPGKDCAHYWATVSVNCDYRSTLEIRRYLCGLEPPNYPVPAIPYKVCFYASGDCIEIRSFKGVGSKRSYIDKIFWKPV